jgi:oxalate decarboxylase
MAVLYRRRRSHDGVWVRKQGPDFDYRAGDAGYVPFAMGNYIENTGFGPLRFLEMFRSERYTDLSLNQWLALTPRVLVEADLKIGGDVIAALPSAKIPIVPG